MKVTAVDIYLHLSEYLLIISGFQLSLQTRIFNGIILRWCFWVLFKSF